MEHVDRATRKALKATKNLQILSAQGRHLIYVASDPDVSAAAYTTIRNEVAASVNLESGQVTKYIPRPDFTLQSEAQSTPIISNLSYGSFKDDHNERKEITALFLHRYTISRTLMDPAFDNYTYEDATKENDLKNPICVLDTIRGNRVTHDDSPDCITLDDLVNKASTLEIDPMLLYQAWRSEQTIKSEITIDRTISVNPYVSAAFAALRWSCKTAAVHKDHTESIIVFEAIPGSRPSATKLSYEDYLRRLPDLGLTGEYDLGKHETAIPQWEYAIGAEPTRPESAGIASLKHE